MSLNAQSIQIVNVPVFCLAFEQIHDTHFFFPLDTIVGYKTLCNSTWIYHVFNSAR